MQVPDGSIILVAKFWNFIDTLNSISHAWTEEFSYEMRNAFTTVVPKVTRLNNIQPKKIVLLLNDLHLGHTRNKPCKMVR